MKSNPNDHNPFALPMQLAFFEQRLKIEKEADHLVSDPSKSGQAVSIIDRSIYEDHEIFAKNQLKSGMFTQSEYKQYLLTFEASISGILRPDVVILLDPAVSVLLNRIRLRGRQMETSITREYLENLQHHYSNGLERYLKSIEVLVTKPSLLIDKTDPTSEEVNTRVLSEVKRLLKLQ